MNVIKVWKQAGMPGIVGALTLLAGAPSILAQPAGADSADSAGSASQTVSRAEVPAPPIAPVGSMVRAIPDAASGDCWLLERDDTRAGGPGRLVRLGSGSAACAMLPAFAKTAPARAGSETGPGARRRAGTPLIRAGAPLVLEEITPAFQARLEAVALEPGWEGGVLRVRLKAGGRVLRAVLLGPARARLLPERGAWR